MSFYRTYRPQRIEDLDNVNARKQISDLLSQNVSDLPHAYLFCGQRGIGKTTSARLVAKLFNCTKRVKGKGPCGSCDQCVSIQTGTNLDVIEMDAASNRRIDEIRTLRERVGLTPSVAKYTVYIIDEVHMLTTEAFNALLKTLEEPPSHVIFILATTDPQKVPQTIQSRCLIISFSRATDRELTGVIEKIAKIEKLSIDTDACDLIVSYADGSFRDAVKALEQASLSGSPITAQSVRESLALGEKKYVTEFVRHLHDGSVKVLFEDINNTKEAGIDMKMFITDVLMNLKERLIYLAGSGDSSETSLNQCKREITIFTRAFAEMKYNPVTELPLMTAVVDCIQENSDFHTVSPPDTSQKNTASGIKADQRNSDQSSASDISISAAQETSSLGIVTMEKVTECWKDIIEECKPFNHSIAGVLRSAKPYSVEHGIVTIAANYKFHQEKLSEPKVKDIIVQVIKKLFGEKVKVEIVLGKK